MPDQSPRAYPSETLLTLWQACTTSEQRELAYELFCMLTKVDDYSFIYFIGREEGPVKIGVSRNPSERLVGLQTGCPFPLKLHGHWMVENTRIYAVERTIHSALEPYRAQGEWFSLTPKEAAKLTWPILKGEVACTPLS